MLQRTLGPPGDSTPAHLAMRGIEGTKKDWLSLTGPLDQQQGSYYFLWS
jgi:hypothetical protein